jgi:hypothetical protein
MISTGVKAARFVRYVLQLALSLLFRSSLMSRSWEGPRGATDNMHGQIRKISLLFRMSRPILGLGRRRLQ